MGKKDRVINCAQGEQSMLGKVGVAPAPAGSQQRPTESGSSAYGPALHLRLLPTSPRGGAFIFGYRPESGCLERTRTFPTARPAHGRTSDGLPGRLRPADAGRYKPISRERRCRGSLARALSPCTFWIVQPSQPLTFFSSQAMFSPSTRIVRSPSSSASTSPMFLPMPRFQ